MADDTDFDGLSLDHLRRRRSFKWRTFPPDVLPAFVAELDVPLADPVRRRPPTRSSRRRRLHRPAGLPAAFAGFAARSVRVGRRPGGRARRPGRDGRDRRGAAGVPASRAGAW